MADDDRNLGGGPRLQAGARAAMTDLPLQSRRLTSRAMAQPDGGAIRGREREQRLVRELVRAASITTRSGLISISAIEDASDAYASATARAVRASTARSLPGFPRKPAGNQVGCGFLARNPMQ